MKSACDDQGRADTFHGYGPEQGYDFLKDAIRGYYDKQGISLEPQEIFIKRRRQKRCRQYFRPVFSG